MIQGIAAIDSVRQAAGVLDGVANIAGPGRLGVDVGPGAGVETSFGAALASASAEAVGTLRKAEGLSLTALQGGNVETREVVDAVMNAEQTLQAAIAIRDKIVSAYLEVSRMAI